MTKKIALIVAAAKSVGPRMQASESVPFLSKPKNLDSSLPGYVGFDPLGFSDYFDLKWLQVFNGLRSFTAIRSMQN